MKVYCVWAGYNYYPEGPNDLKGVFFAEEDANALEQSLREIERIEDGGAYDWVTQTLETVK
jgi:hypothetical protein